jgi:GMP synthase-like glutamine amidotransferase
VHDPKDGRWMKGLSVPRCLVLQHVEPEGPFAVAAALARAGVELDVRRVFAGDAVPTSAEGLAAVVAMGGPMSMTSDDGFPTRRRELGFLADAARGGVPVLGVCLGAQLLAAALGAEVVAGGHGPEIGWGPVTLNAAARDDPLFAGLPEVVEVLHWHGDTFDLPPGAELLASSSRYANQAFRVGEVAWGLQFHLEVDEAAVGLFLEHFGADAARQGVDPRVIAAATPVALARLAPVQRLVLDRFAALVRDRAQLRATGG